MDYERIRNFIISYSRDDKGVLGDIYNEALEHEVPVIRVEMRDFLRVMLDIVKPHNVLEIGTAVGYSTLVIADKLLGLYETDWQIDTYELDEGRVAEAKNNIRRYMDTYLQENEALKARHHSSGNEADYSSGSAVYASNITIHQGDAAKLLSEVQHKTYDLVFIDAAKAQYKNYLKEAIRLSHPGTVIITDNILTDGEVLESHFLVEKRDRTIHDRMREYVYSIKNDDRLDTAILSVADGVAVSVVRKKDN